MIKNNISFTGYDARKLDGFVMKSNHGNIANEMIDIGQKEGFNVYFMERQPESDTFEISKNKKQPAEERIGGWPQDLWSIIGKKLLTFENSTQSDAISEKFNLIYDKTQNEIRKNKNIPQYYQMLNTIVNMPRVDLPAGSGYLLADPQTGELNILPENFVISEYEKLSQTLKNTLQNTHIPGGNYYLAKNTSGKETALVEKDSFNRSPARSVAPSTSSRPPSTPTSDRMTVSPKSSHIVPNRLTPAMFRWTGSSILASPLKVS